MLCCDQSREPDSIADSFCNGNYLLKERIGGLLANTAGTLTHESRAVGEVSPVRCSGDRVFDVSNYLKIGRFEADPAPLYVKRKSGKKALSTRIAAIAKEPSPLGVFDLVSQIWVLDEAIFPSELSEGSLNNAPVPRRPDLCL
jgi:hypothetical protein